MKHRPLTIDKNLIICHTAWWSKIKTIKLQKNNSLSTRQGKEAKMNTRNVYRAITNDLERAAAISIIVDVQKHLKEKPEIHLFTVEKECPQFTEKAAAFVKNELRGDIATLAFCFTSGKVTVAITTAKEEALAS